MAQGVGEVRLAELCGVLSLACDLALGQPIESGIRSTLIALGIADSLGLDTASRSDVYYLNLLRMAGCTASPELAQPLGDLRALGALFDREGVDFGDRRRAAPLILRHLTHGRSRGEQIRNLARATSMRPALMRDTHRSHCDVAKHLALQFDATPAVRTSLDYVFERWDGRGTPNGVAGEQIPLATRIVLVAYHAEIHHRIGGIAQVVAMLASRRGAAFDPEVVDRFVPVAGEVLAVLGTPSPWGALLDREPGTPRLTDDEGIDAALSALADFSEPLPWMRGHGRRVADLVAQASPIVGLGGQDAVVARRAAMVHDAGNVGVATLTLDRPGQIGDAEWEDVRLHAYHSERIVGRASVLRDVGRLAGLHHERCDGTGYHRQLSAAAIPLAARLVAAADVFDALRSERPHRPKLPDAEAAVALERLADDGALDAIAVSAVLGGTEGASSKRLARRPMGLTDREVDVLRLIATGLSIKQVAQHLAVRPKTVDAHLQNIYPKLGVSTRAGATLCAVEHGLVGPTAIGRSPD